MIVPYYDLSDKTIELSKLTEENIKKGVVSRKLKITPGFIMPDNSLYYITTVHFSASFYEEIEKIFNLIRKSEVKELNIKEKIVELKQKLILDYNRFKNNDISAFDIRDYLGLDCFRALKYNPTLKGIHSEECKKILLMLVNSKIKIYNYFLKLVDDSPDLVEALNSHPVKSKDYNYDEFILRVQTMKKESEAIDYMVIDSIINVIKEQQNYTLNNLDFPSFMSDFAVTTIGIDKIETHKNKTITTTKLNIYESYFNYLLMDYDIVQLPKVVFDKNKNSFEKVEQNEFSLSKLEDEKYKQEIELIKKMVPYKDRSKYFI